MNNAPSIETLKSYLEAEGVSSVVPFNKSSDKIVPLDLSGTNPELSPELLADTDQFSQWVNNFISLRAARYAVGGYNERRIIYARSSHFNAEDEPRELHLGTDIWSPAGTPVYSPINATVHSFKFNEGFGDYGATIILKHQLNDIEFYSLFGHLSLTSIRGLIKGQHFSKGQQLATLGNPDENGNWPPHLHFQLMFDLQNMGGDYPGVCKFSERSWYLSNCPDPHIILKYTFE